jgi:phenolic acid decarboxylase
MVAREQQACCCSLEDLVSDGRLDGFLMSPLVVERRHVLLLCVFTDHLKRTRDKLLRNAGVMCRRHFIEDFAPTLHYIKGVKNEEADALSRLKNMVAEAFASLPFGYAIMTSSDQKRIVMSKIPLNWQNQSKGIFGMTVRL